MRNGIGVRLRGTKSPVNEKKNVMKVSRTVMAYFGQVTATRMPNELKTNRLSTSSKDA